MAKLYSVLKEFWNTSFGVWSVVALVILLTYAIAIHEAFNIVGGIK